MERIAVDGEGGGRRTCDFPVEVDRHRPVGDHPHRPSRDVVHLLVLDEGAVLEQPGDGDVVAHSTAYDGVDVKQVIVE
jgi:hypothetical protein